MAVVAHTPYTGSADCARTNEYLTDGHGLAIDRTNRYISDGHGGHTLCEGYNCPADPILATEYMNTLRLNYERQHPPGEGRTKGCVTHEQIYVSPTAEDNVPPEERMEMTRKLIERTALRDFACLYVPHDNTPDKHCHISCCPYSLPDENGKVHKLCMNNALLNDLRREMDRICVEHGYSIIENPELWSDKEYRDWFFHIKEEGIVTVHPPREQDMTSFKQDRKRARTYSASKKAQALREEAKVDYYKRMTKGYNEKSAHLFYTPPHLYNPTDPEREYHIRKGGNDGKMLSELEQSATALFVWAYSCEKEIERRKISGSTGLQRRMAALTNKAYAANKLIHDLDIRTHGELITHIKEVGSDIADLKQDIRRQETIMERMADIMDAIDRWENAKDPEALEYLEAHRCGSPEQIADAKKRYSRAVARKASNEVQLQECSTEYRHLKEAEGILHPARSEELWTEYVEKMFSKEIEKKIGFSDPEKMTKHLQQMGKIAGLAPEEIDKLIANAKKTASSTTWVEYRAFMRITFTADDGGVVSAIYDKIGDAYDDIRRLHALERSALVFGPVSLLFALAVGIYAGWKEAALEREIEALKWEAEIQKEYAKQARMGRQKAMKDAKAEYDAETLDASEAEISAARIRYYERAAEINGRLDILMDIQRMKNEGSLDSKIEAAVSKRLGQDIIIKPAPEQER